MVVGPLLDGVEKNQIAFLIILLLPLFLICGCCLLRLACSRAVLRVVQQFITVVSSSSTGVM
jgi:hypothetical protein